MTNNESLDIYAQAMEELKLGTYDLGLYGRVLCECDGNEAMTRARYIRARVEHYNEMRRRETSQREAEEHRQRLAAWNHNRFEIRRRSSSSSHPFKDESRASSTVRLPENTWVNMFVKWVSH